MWWTWQNMRKTKKMHKNSGWKTSKNHFRYLLNKYLANYAPDVHGNAFYCCPVLTKIRMC